jgi:hypothetical protein
MSSIIKVDQIQLADGSTPTAGDLGLNTTGSVLQVVSATTTTQAVSSTGTLADTGLSASITPSATSSKILVLFDHGEHRITGSSATALRIDLYKDSTELKVFAYYAGYGSGYTNIHIGSVSGSYLDSPSTTSAITYKTRFSRPYGSGEVVVQADSAASTITLLEIAG